MSKLELTQIIFDELVDLLYDEKTEEFVGYFNNGCENIDILYYNNKIFMSHETILFIAGYFRNIEAMKCLIKNGANINAKVKNYDTVIDRLCRRMILTNFCGCYGDYGVDDYTFMKFCLENGANPNIKIRNNILSFKNIMLHADQNIIELFINYGVDLHNFFIYGDDDKNYKVYILKILCKNIKLGLESKLRLINKIKHICTDDELYNLSKNILESDIPHKEKIAEELDTIESNGKSAAKIKIA